MTSKPPSAPQPPHGGNGNGSQNPSTAPPAFTYPALGPDSAGPSLLNAPPNAPVGPAPEEPSFRYGPPQLTAPPAGASPSPSGGRTLQASTSAPGMRYGAPPPTPGFNWPSNTANFGTQFSGQHQAQPPQKAMPAWVWLVVVLCGFLLIITVFAAFFASRSIFSSTNSVDFDGTRSNSFFGSPFDGSEYGSEYGETGEAFVAKGTLVLGNSGNRYNGISGDNSGCRSDYLDIYGGTPITLTSSEGFVSVSNMEYTSGDLGSCTFKFTFSKVPPGMDPYTISLGRHGELDFTENEMRIGPDIELGI